MEEEEEDEDEVKEVRRAAEVEGTGARSAPGSVTEKTGSSMNLFRSENRNFQQIYLLISFFKGSPLRQTSEKNPTQTEKINLFGRKKSCSFKIKHVNLIHKGSFDQNKFKKNQ